MYKKLFALLLVGLILYIYRSVFINSTTSGGDLPYYWDTYIRELGIPYLWNPHWPTGMGGNQGIILPLKLYLQLPIALFVNQLHVPWEFVERIVFFVAFFVLAIYSSYRLSRSWIGSFLYASNTWILMVFSGGQMGIALAYSVAPLVLARFIMVANSQKSSSHQVIKSSIVAGLLFAVLLMFDMRVAYITLIAVGLYMVIKSSSHQVFKPLHALRFTLYAILIPLGITTLLHSFWILPLVFGGGSGINLAGLAPTVEQVKFFSFATFSNTLGLLHPNWPENVFGKVGFMKAEFLLLPILAYSSLFFLNSKSEARNSKQIQNLKSKIQKTKFLSPRPYPLSPRTILFFALLGLLGAFLAKGANEPFGGVYLWMFEHIPGFNLFRDSTKWYILVALSYSVLIPFSIVNIYGFLSKRTKSPIYNFQFAIKSKIFNFQNLFILLLASYFLLLSYPVLSGQVGGIFKQHVIPQEYVQLKQFLEQDKNFSRTLWIPQHQRFGYFAGQHPAINGQDLFGNIKVKDIVKKLKKPETLGMLQNMSVRYVILPYDSEGEIFLDDRKYSEKKYQEMVKWLDEIKWLKRVDCSIAKPASPAGGLLNCSGSPFGKIVVYEVPGAKEHFWSPSKEVQVSYKYVNPTKYLVSIKNTKKEAKLIFAESYDKGWKANVVIKSSPIRQDFAGQASHQVESIGYNGLNSFVLPQEGSYDLEVVYEPQKWMNLGMGVSLGTLLVMIGSLLMLRRKK